MEHRRYRFLLIVLRGDGHGRRAALGVNVGIRLGDQEKAAVRRECKTVSRDLAVARVGHPRLDAIGQVLLLAVNLRRNRNLQLAVGVERPAVLALLFSAVRVSALWIVSVGIVALLIRAGFLVAFVAPHRPVRRGVHHPLHLGIRDGLAKVIARVNRRLDRLALQHARWLRRHLHLVLGFLVVLHRKAGALDVALAHLHREVIEPEISLGGDHVIPFRRAHVGELHGLRPDGFVVARIAQFQLQLAALRNDVTAHRLRANDGFEMHRIAGPIHRPIGVGVATQTAVWIVTQVPCAGRVDRELVCARRHHRNVLGLLAG